MKNPRKARTLGIAVAIAALPRVAFAQPEQNNVQPVRLSYAADSTCPSKEDFVQAIRERGLSIRASDDAERAMSVTLVRDSQTKQWNGEMRVHDAHGDASRDVSAGSCAEVARSIALFASLALTPETETPTPTPVELPKRIDPPIPPKNKPIVTIAPPPKIESPSLSRHRYSLGAEMIFDWSSRTFENFAGIGVVGAYHVTDRFALGLSADVLHSFDDYPTPAATASVSGAGSIAIQTPGPNSNLALARFMARAPISLHVARGAVDGPAGSPLDVFVTPQIGTVLTKPNGLPSQVPENVAPSLAAEVDLGARAFMTPSFAITAAIGVLFLEERYVRPDYLYDARSRLELATYNWSYNANLGALFQLGAEFDWPSLGETR